MSAGGMNQDEAKWVRAQRLYGDGLTLSEIAGIIGRDRSTVGRALRKRGTVMRKRTRKPGTHTVPRRHFDRDGRARCGRPGTHLTADEADVECLLCLNLLAGTGTRWDVEPCGTEAAYRREKRREEQGGPPVHERCRRAASRAAADRRARRRSRREVLAA